MSYTLDQLKELTKTGLFDFTFTKVNGDTRELRGTRDASLMPAAESSLEGKQPRLQSTAFAVYDIEIGAWRSMKPENVIAVIPVETVA